ncbi:MAG: hypothetical protein JSV90_01425 [Methanobacteriota archaeon]|nr:MAG: hypothetical protein JSV90_01425 [Euryarchaeota archaeon]
MCTRLCACDTRLPRWVAMRRARVASPPTCGRRHEALSRCLAQASIDLTADQVSIAARLAALMSFLALTPAVALALLSLTGEGVASTAFVLLVVPMIAREAVLSYPRTVAVRHASRVTRSSTECITLMIMCLRHEPSLPKAIAFAARRSSEFAHELRATIWSVMTGRHSTFESALNALGDKWSDRSPELKSSIQAMITASCEATEAGERRALDRASKAIVAGVRRRIEEYALSLSVPSMILFGVGIILPLMVGSFLPLLSWDVWDGSAAGSFESPAGVPRPTGHVVLLMNVAFPAVGLLVAIDALSRHPLAQQASICLDFMQSRAAWRHALLASGAALGGLAVSSALLHGAELYMAVMLSASVPAAASLAIYGARVSAASPPRNDESVGDLLFGTGARMVEGENFESAFAKAATAVSGSSSAARPHLGVGGTRRLAHADGAPLGALEVVTEAATKDEAQAGVLAMDLSGYLKEVSELQAATRRRLRPTVSMMRITAHVLAPMVLGITHAIYLSLASMGRGGAVPSGQFFVILGLFLAETNAVVAYFVWGFGDRRAPGELAKSVGACVLISSLVYSATVAVAS